jgi:hypothetical protein
VSENGLSLIRLVSEGETDAYENFHQPDFAAAVCRYHRPGYSFSGEQQDEEV